MYLIVLVCQWLYFLVWGSTIFLLYSMYVGKQWTFFICSSFTQWNNTKRSLNCVTIHNVGTFTVNVTSNTFNVSFPFSQNWKVGERADACGSLPKERLDRCVWWSARVWERAWGKHEGWELVLLCMTVAQHLPSHASVVWWHRFGIYPIYFSL